MRPPPAAAAFPLQLPAELDPLDSLDPLFLATIIDPGRRQVRAPIQARGVLAVCP